VVELHASRLKTNPGECAPYSQETVQCGGVIDGVLMHRVERERADLGENSIPCDNAIQPSLGILCEERDEERHPTPAADSLKL